MDPTAPPTFSLPSLLFGLRAPVSRKRYLLAGAALFALKYAVDSAVVYAFVRRAWPPQAYFIPSLAMRDRLLGSNVPTAMHATLALASLPFLWVGLSMSVRRAANAGQSPWWGVLFLVPGLNWILLAVLSLLPTRSEVPWGAPASTPFRPQPGREPSAPLESGVRDSVLAVLAGVAFGLAMTAPNVYGLRTYGAALFFATPFAMGIVTTLVSNRGPVRTLGSTIALAVLTVFATGAALLLFALEGVLCLLMATPIAIAVATVGAMVAWAIIRQTRHGAQQQLQVLGIFLVGLPGLAGLEAKIANPMLHEAVSVREINAPPSVVWRHVVGFSELPPPPEWFFRLGVAYPMRARIQGEGVGAVRNCEFSTGPFVEPITRWEPGARLSFDVRSQPPSMTELSPYRHVNAPHLEGYMVSRRGEFRLTALPGGRTRLEGSTWYTMAIFPESYWVVPAELLLHAIHDRVLAHVADLSEHDAVR